MGSGPNNPEKEASPANVSHAKLMLCNPESPAVLYQCRIYSAFLFCADNTSVHFAYRKRVCSEVGYGLRALGASLRIADRGGVFKGKGTVTAHFILQRELPTFHPPWISRASAPFFAIPPALQCMLVIMIISFNFVNGVDGGLRFTLHSSRYLSSMPASFGAKDTSASLCLV